ncbi:MAG TPA: sensor histidine kinase [Bacteroidia bacterium]|jgi:two-component sensor histidine kinase
MVKKDPENEKRAAEILEVIMSYARLDFSVKTSLTDKGDVLDAIASGVNMLGEELQSSAVTLKEKDHLLREIHHRVKNNMQIISSLLNLQSEHVKDERFLNMIKDSRNRINAMAFIHEMLYATADFKFTNFESYIQKLSRSLISSYSENTANIQFNIQVDKTLRFDVDRMIPLGLILNEAITNSFKYAFPQKDSSAKIINISMEINDKGQYQLFIGDNGVGLPQKFEMKKDANLGMQLILLLSEQIDAKVDLMKAKGTVYRLTF